MKTMSILITLILVTALPHLAIAQSPIPLLCKGDIETTTDGETDRKRVALDVLLNLQNSSVEINGYWGCLASLNPQDNFNCLGKLPVNVTDAEITFSATSSGDKYEGFSQFKINRYSGSFVISSFAFAKPPANATWAMITISGKLECKRPEKQF